MVKTPTLNFTTQELRAIHRELVNLGWNSEAFYQERKEVVKKLDLFFKGDTNHVKKLTR